MPKLLKFWNFLTPPKFYGGGGGSYVTPQANPQQQALADIAQQKYDTYQKQFVPVENAQIKQVAGLNGPAWHNLATGMTGADIQQAGNNTANFGRSMVGGREGAGNYNDIATAKSGAQSEANSGVTQRYMGAEQGLVNMGNGQSSQAIQGLSSVAKQATEGNIANANNALTAGLLGQQTLGTAAGGLTAGLMHYAGKG
jgi:hypothetical protein